ncbi:MAG: hypothetical protein EOM25_14960, partial [Deltaproteobacteria bacterium]|nr:hypothetical protein [Deltaproteobacteria bacterium]
RIPGQTMEDKRRYFMGNFDHIRLQLTREPRGDRDLLAALLTEATSDEGEFGLVFMDARRYPYLCGHATIGAVTTLIETGNLPADGPERVVIVDTPSGPVKTTAHIHEDRVTSVATTAVPSFVYESDTALFIPGLGKITVDTVCVGGFFVMVSTREIGLDLVPENGPAFISLGMSIIEEANRQLNVEHPTRPGVTTVDVVEFYDPGTDDQGLGRNAVVYGESHLDRSPCGTGTAAKLTLLHSKGLLDVGTPFYNQSLLGSRFEGRVTGTTKVGHLDGVRVEIIGSAHITGVHEFVLDPRDPFPQGFLL